MTEKLETCDGNVKTNYAYGVADTVRDTHVRKKARLDFGWRGQAKKARSNGDQARELGRARGSQQYGTGASRYLRAVPCLNV